jgi:hypothetical protein
VDLHVARTGEVVLDKAHGSQCYREAGRAW